MWYDTILMILYHTYVNVFKIWMYCVNVCIEILIITFVVSNYYSYDVNQLIFNKLILQNMENTL